MVNDADTRLYSYAEMALVLGCAIGTVRSRLHNAKAHLQQLLEQPK